MSIGEPQGWKQARDQRLQGTYPELQVASPGEVLATDAYRLSMGQPVSSFSQCVMRLAAHASGQR